MNKKINWMIFLLIFILVPPVFSQIPTAPMASAQAARAQATGQEPEETPKQVIGGFGNGLGYTEQFEENIKQGTGEIVHAGDAIAPSFKEQEVTKMNAPFFGVLDKGQAYLLAFINVTGSVCRGVWRILVSPFPIVQKVQP